MQKIRAGDIVRVLKGPYAGAITIVARRKDGWAEAGGKYNIRTHMWVLTEFLSGYDQPGRYARLHVKHIEFLEKVGRVKTSRLNAG